MVRQYVWLGPGLDRDGWLKVPKFEVSPLAYAFYNETRGRTFTSDDFRELGYDDCMRRPDKAIGNFFGQLVRHGLAMQVGWVRSRIPSNHIRKIRTYAWTSKAEEVLR
jgi:hypothetical protein